MDIRPETSPPPEPLASTKADVKRLAANSASVVAELQQFLAEMRGKSPKEMLGAVARTSLVGSTVTASFYLALVIALFTVGPYTWDALFAADDDPPAAESADAGAPPDPAPGAGTDPAATGAAAAAAENPAPADAAARQKDILGKLGVGGETAAPPDINPLENANDDILKDLE